MQNKRHRYPEGQRWRCEYKMEPSKNFTFVVLGKGSAPEKKRCRIEYDFPNGTTRVNFEAEYTHNHLKKYGRLEEQ
jgi:hypothetical protein